VVRRSTLRPGRLPPLVALVALVALITVLSHFVGPSIVQGHHGLPTSVAATSVASPSSPEGLDGRSLNGVNAGPTQAVAGLLEDHKAEEFGCGILVLSLLVLLLLRRGRSRGSPVKMRRPRVAAGIRPGDHPSSLTSSHQKRLAVLSVSRC